MRLPRTRITTRSGLTLLEVLVSVAIFLFSLVALSQLMSMATDRAREVQSQSRAVRLAQSKLNEVAAGVIAVNSSSSGTFDPEEPDWQWSVDSESDSTAANLWKVNVRVWRDRPDGTTVETNLAQYIFDPTQRGTITQQQQNQQSTTDQISSSSSGSSPSQSTPSSNQSNPGSGNGRPNTGSPNTGSPGGRTPGGSPGMTQPGGGSPGMTQPGGGNRPSGGMPSGGGPPGGGSPGSGNSGPRPGGGPIR
jgi:type II secretion system protein I